MISTGIILIRERRDRFRERRKETNEPDLADLIDISAVRAFHPRGMGKNVHYVAISVVIYSFVRHC